MTRTEFVVRLTPGPLCGAQSCSVPSLAASGSSLSRNGLIRSSIAPASMPLTDTRTLVWAVTDTIEVRQFVFASVAREGIGVPEADATACTDPLHDKKPLSYRSATHPLDATVSQRAADWNRNRNRPRIVFAPRTPQHYS